ncbi:MAG: hypothetical protein KAS97_10500 [Candidatus Aminicenantes bacterium]|nr:hypothetical protein [Candidatus Aminicenantes bacterium]
MKRVIYIFIIVSLFVISMASCKTNDAVDDGTETPPANTVYIYDNYFLPSTLTISSPNTVITWVNKGSSSHTVTVGSPNTPAELSGVLQEKFNSGTLAPGISFKHTFQWEGDWKYYCQIHPQMRAEIKVKF